MKRLSKVVVAGLLVAGVMGLWSGCVDRIGAKQDPEGDRQVVMQSYWLREHGVAKVMPVQLTGSGQMRVVIQLYNRWDSDVGVDYQYWFIDQAGAIVDSNNTAPPKGFVKVPARNTAQFEIISMSA